jgi:YfiH family protein
MWSIGRGASAAYARCAALEVDGVAHGFGLRASHADGGDLFEGQAYRLRQVHGERLVKAGHAGQAGGPEEEADGSWAQVQRLNDTYLAVRTADCVPILFASRDGTLVAAVHAGWRGTAKGIAAKAVRLLEQEGCPPTRLIAAAGPSIGVCCYPVSRQVATQVADGSGVAIEAVSRCEAGQVRLDLRAAIRAQLRGAGMPDDSVQSAPWCTACEADLFFSYRREGAAAGRQLSVIGPQVPRP